MRKKLIELLITAQDLITLSRKADFLIDHGVTIPVRCWECKHSKKYKCKVDPMYNHLVCFRREHYSEPVDEDHFCSYGERKDNDQK